MKNMITDLAKVLRLSPLEVVFNSDVVFVEVNGELRIAKHDRSRAEVKVPHHFKLTKVELEDGRILTTVIPVEPVYDGKDKIRRTY
jgi:hypothetical protein